MTAPANNLFGPPEAAPGASTGTVPTVFADVVFDRPLDHAYTYAVPDHLKDRVGVGKRVECPFGRGDKGTVGYCIRVADVPPVREVSSTLRSCFSRSDEK